MFEIIVEWDRKARKFTTPFGSRFDTRDQAVATARKIALHCIRPEFGNIQVTNASNDDPVWSLRGKFFFYHTRPIVLSDMGIRSI